MSRTSHTPFADIIPQIITTKKVALTNTPTGTATDTQYFYSNTTFSASYDILDANIVSFKGRFVSSGIAATGAGNAIGLHTVFIPHASDTVDPAYIGAMFDLANLGGDLTTTDVGSATKIGIVFRGVGWASNIMSLTSDMAFAAGQQISDDDGKSISFVAGDGVGTNKNGGGINITAGSATGSGVDGTIVFSAGGAAIAKVNSSSIYAAGDGMQVAGGRVTAPAQVSSGTTVTLTVGTNDQVQRYDFAAGGGTYTYNIDLLKGVGEVEGNYFELYINKAASANPTIVVRNGSGGSSLLSINNASAQNWYTKFVFDGTDWVKQAAIINDL